MTRQHRTTVRTLARRLLGRAVVHVPENHPAGQSKWERENPRATQPPQPKPVGDPQCESCHGEGTITEYVWWIGHGSEPVVMPCPCALDDA